MAQSMESVKDLSAWALVLKDGNYVLKLKMKDAEESHGPVIKVAACKEIYVKVSAKENDFILAASKFVQGDITGSNASTIRTNFNKKMKVSLYTPLKLTNC